MELWRPSLRMAGRPGSAAADHLQLLRSNSYEPREAAGQVPGSCGEKRKGNCPGAGEVEGRERRSEEARRRAADAVISHVLQKKVHAANRADEDSRVAQIWNRRVSIAASYPELKLVIVSER